MRRASILGTDRLALVAFGLACFWTADRAGAFWWFDSASHALNGVFLYDFLADGGVFDPIGFTLSYYARIPGLTLGFYPPGFALLQVPFYGVMGVGGAAAQACVTVCAIALGFAVLELGRELGWRPWPAAAAGLVIMAFPEMLLWSRQIQPEIPAIAALTWAVVALVRWRRTGRPAQLWWAAALYLASLYIKQTGAFLLPLLLVALFFELRRRPEARGEIRRVAIAFCLAATPLLALSIAFGGFNLKQALSAPEAQAASFYLTALPAQIGVPALILAVIGGFASLRGHPTPAARWLLLAWLGLGFLVFSVVALKSPRFTTVLLPPIALLATLPFQRLAAPGGLRIGIMDGAIWLTAVVYAVANLSLTPVRRHQGLAEAAALVAERTPPGGGVLLLAHRSSNFLFGLRAVANRKDLRVTRAEQAYVDYSVSKAFGAIDSGRDGAAIMADIDRWNIATLAIQRGMWSDLPSIAALQAVATGPEFRRIATAPLIESEGGIEQGYLDVYERLNFVSRPKPPHRVKLPIVGWEVTLPEG